jgi:hypothetical protein
MADETAKDRLKDLKSYALSNFDIKEVMPTNIFTYPHLQDVKHIDEVLDHDGRAIVLYLTDNEQTGHWVSLIKRDGNIEIFDPYGFAPDTQGKNLGVGAGNLKRFGQDRPLLTNLIKASGYGIKYNSKRVQPFTPSIATCGRHALMRLLASHLPLDEYNKRLMKISKDAGVSPDDIATVLTAELLGK